MTVTWETVDKSKEYAFLDNANVPQKLRNKKGKFVKVYRGSLPIHPFAEFKLEDGSQVEIHKYDLKKLTEVK